MRKQEETLRKLKIGGNYDVLQDHVKADVLLVIKRERAHAKGTENKEKYCDREWAWQCKMGLEGDKGTD